jgi:L-aminopeptidase/D-esterase-like protein
VPAHTSGDGDIAFAISMGTLPVQPHELLSIGTLTAHTIENAVLRSVTCATGLKGIPSAAEWLRA